MEAARPSRSPFGRPDSPARVLSTAKNRAGEYAVRAATAGDHEKARRWSDLAVRIDALAVAVIEEMARV